MKKMLVFAVLAYSSALCAIEGIYQVQGYDPYEKKNYSGEAVITKDENGVYQGTWNEDGKKFMGTGLKTDNSFSFIFANEESPEEAGLVVYKIEGANLKGPWVTLGKSLIGSETLTSKAPK